MLDIQRIPLFRDNYCYLIRAPGTGAVACVDPGVHEPVVAALDDRGWTLDLILLTHHHADHIGGADALKVRYGADIVGAEADRHRIAALDRGVGHGDTVRLGEHEAKVIATPGHTLGHIAFWFSASGAVFCGDTLFSLGCGRVFEGSHAQMWDSLQALRGLPDDTMVYCGHEYTEANGQFALAVDPDNRTLHDAVAEDRAHRAQGRPTIPCHLGEEKRTNPFLRADDPALAAALGLSGRPAVEVFTALRQRKDTF